MSTALWLILGLALTAAIAIFFWGLCVIACAGLERWAEKAKRRSNFIADAELDAHRITPLFDLKDWEENQW
jgi:hypothetical protein